MNNHHPPQYMGSSIKKSDDSDQTHPKLYPELKDASDLNDQEHAIRAKLNEWFPTLEKVAEALGVDLSRLPLPMKRSSLDFSYYAYHLGSKFLGSVAARVSRLRFHVSLNKQRALHLNSLKMILRAAIVEPRSCSTYHG